jgi:urease accessory protein UreE
MLLYVVLEWSVAEKRRKRGRNHSSQKNGLRLSTNSRIIEVVKRKTVA